MLKKSPDPSKNQDLITSRVVEQPMMEDAMKYSQILATT